MEKLVNIFNEIRSCYFPRWDIKKEWTIEVVPTLSASGRCGSCDPVFKEIGICLPTEESNDTLYTLIIHEITHAAVNRDHSKKFLARLLKAADKAQAIGEINLADEIRQNAYFHGEALDTHGKLLAGASENLTLI